MKLINGGVYRGNRGVFSLVYFNPDSWGMLHIERHNDKGMSCPMFQHDNNGKFVLSVQELRDKFDLDNWQLLDGRLRIEKIDDLTFVEYTRGQLEEVV